MTHITRQTRVTLRFTFAEVHALLWAAGNMTSGNARDIDEMKACGMTTAEARALLAAEAKMEEALKEVDRHAPQEKRP